MNDDQTKQFVQFLIDNKEIVTNEAGFYVYWPDENRKGYLDSMTLRIIYEALVELNKPLEQELEEYFKNNP